MKLGRCVETGLGQVGCYKDVLLMADKRCSGRKNCEINVPNAEFEATRPCLRELKSYLEVSYRCVQGKIVERDILTLLQFQLCSIIITLNSIYFVLKQ